MLPLAAQDKPWDADAAEARVRAWAGGEEHMDWSKYSQAFLWHDKEHPHNFTSYKLPYADVIDGALKAVPKGIFAAAASLQGARNKPDIPDSDISAIKSHIESHYKAMDMEAPWMKDVHESSLLEAMTPEMAEKMKKALGMMADCREDLPAKGKAALSTLSKMMEYGNTERASSLEEVIADLEALMSQVSGSAKDALVSILEQLRSLSKPADSDKGMESKGDMKDKSGMMGGPMGGWGQNVHMGSDVNVPRSLYASQDLTEAIQLTGPVEGTDGLRWEIVALESGYTKPLKRRLYKPETVERSAQLFEGAKVFLDHMTESQEAARPEGSVRDLVGWLKSPHITRDNGTVQVRATLEALASASDFTPRLREAFERGNPNLFEFSIRGKGQTRWEKQDGRLIEVVESLDSIFSVDVVTAGAAGGRVVRMVASQEQEDELMKLEELTLDELKAVRPDLVESLKESAKPPPEDKTAPPAPSVDPATVTALKEQLERLEHAQALTLYRDSLRATVAASTLPQVAKDRLIVRFQGVVTDMPLVEAAINDELAYLASLSKHVPRDLPEIKGQTDDQVEKYGKALDGLVRGEWVDNVRPFRTLSEAYCRIKNYDLTTMIDSPMEVVNALVRDLGRSGFSSKALGRKSLRESISTSDWAEALGDSITRQLMEEYKMDDKWDDWRKITSKIAHLADTRTQHRILYGDYGSAPTVSEGAAYSTAVSPPDQEITYALSKYGMLENITQEAMLRDDLGALQAIPRRLGRSLKMAVYRGVFAVFTDNNTIGLDSVALFDSTHSNTGTTALSFSELGVIRAAMRQQAALVATGQTAVVYPGFVPKFILVPPELEQLALMIRDSDVVPAATSATGATPSHRNVYKGTFDVVVVDHWTDANNWYAVADPRRFPTLEVAFLGNNEEPELLIEAAEAGSSFTADKVVYKARLYNSAAPLDFRPFYREVVT